MSGGEDEDEIDQLIDELRGVSLRIRRLVAEQDRIHREINDARARRAEREDRQAARVENNPRAHDTSDEESATDEDEDGFVIADGEDQAPPANPVNARSLNERLHQAAVAADPHHPRNWNDIPDDGDYWRQDWVEITNRINHVRGRQVNEQDRFARVTGPITGDRVYFRTLNGFSSWRAPWNIRHVRGEDRIRFYRYIRHGGARPGP